MLLARCCSEGKKGQRGARRAASGPPARETLHTRSLGNTLLPPPASRALRILGALIFHSISLFLEIYCTALVETP